MTEPYRYMLVVDGSVSAGYTAYLDSVDGPLRGWGESPLQAIRALCETLREWPVSGSVRWLGTPDGVKLAREFVPGFEPSSGGAVS